jgi:hypothetical protein
MPGDSEIAELGYGERLLLITLRKIVLGRGRCPALLREIARLPGCDPSDLVRTLAILLSAINNGCRRTVCVGYLGHAGPTFDEQRILALVAATQAEAGDLVAAHLAWLVEAPHQKPVAIAARVLGRLLLGAGVTLEPRTPGASRPLILAIVA